MLRNSASRTYASTVLTVTEIRPKETGKIASKPGFRRMHEVIKHIGVASRLDCWREETKKVHHVDTLEDWASRKPLWASIEALAANLVQGYVADMHLPEMHTQREDLRDKQWENTLLCEQYFLLYEEMSYAMNAGDIGRVETCFMPWVFIFRGCGKHKYVSQMIKFLHNVHRVYPPQLKRAIRMNILCNPMGKRHQFRAIDWWVEHNNLYIKRIYSGAFSNRTKRRILKQAALVEVYKKVRISFKGMFALNHRTYRHLAPKMERTLKKLRTYVETHEVHVVKRARSTKHLVPDVAELGVNKLLSAGMDLDGAGDADDAMDGEIEVNGNEGDLEV
ncbi:hypothetical protein BN946_scf185042.g28 [Trametes cinnabarina]|uniref:DUF6589 domain-containing protein n=1 Tax=Pycnoporus cinnabarinus TaxID=5643 RepID=A0A060S4J7_PYCCI|nr:hypothetical protein BN946_scf185042.g28 [Trametes cinnabarina]